jgi:hypothetical protein
LHAAQKKGTGRTRNDGRNYSLAGNAATVHSTRTPPRPQRTSTVNRGTCGRAEQWTVVETELTDAVRDELR